MDNVTEFFKAHNQRQFEDLIAQYTILSDWFENNFQDVELRIEFNSNNILKIITPKVTILTNYHMNEDDALLMVSSIPITEDRWYNTAYMAKLIASIVPGYKKSMTKAINDWYAQAKEKRNIN